MINVAIIGFGRMGRFYLAEFQKSDRYRVSYICDVDADCRQLAHKQAPEAKVVDDTEEIYKDASVDVVTLCALAGSRKEQIRRALEAGKHVIAEKPIADTIENEWEMVRLAEGSDRFTTVNMYLLNSWYHNEIRRFIDSGEIGELAIIRICHMTPGLAPGEGHETEGPCFHDCGMHYVNLARWYARSEYRTWHAQGMRMWSYKDPWWIQCHGTFQNGIVYDITQGFVYGQMSKDQTHNSYVDLIGTKGICHMTHNFKTAHVELRGVNETRIEERPFGGKNIDRLITEMAESIETGQRRKDMPTFRDSAVASEMAWKMLQDSYHTELPAIGDLQTLEAIRERRRNMTDGYGLLPRNNKNV